MLFVVESDRQQANELAIAVSRCSPRLSNAQGVNRVNAWRRLDAAQFFPLQTSIQVNLVPGQLPNLVERLKRNGVRF